MTAELVNRQQLGDVRSPARARWRSAPRSSSSSSSTTGWWRSPAAPRWFASSAIRRGWGCASSGWRATAASWSTASSRRGPARPRCRPRPVTRQIGRVRARVGPRAAVGGDSGLLHVQPAAAHRGRAAVSSRRTATSRWGPDIRSNILDRRDQLLVRCRAKVAANTGSLGRTALYRRRARRPAASSRADRQAFARQQPSERQRCWSSSPYAVFGWAASRSAPGEARAVAIPLGAARAAAGRQALVSIPAWVVVGKKPGPRVSVVAAVRGVEATAARAAAKLAARLDPAALTGQRRGRARVAGARSSMRSGGRAGRPWRFPGDASGARAARDAFHVVFGRGRRCATP